MTAGRSLSEQSPDEDRVGVRNRRAARLPQVRGALPALAAVAVLVELAVGVDEHRRLEGAPAGVRFHRDANKYRVLDNEGATQHEAEILLALKLT
eukprot:CAMPEP_0175224236 /NCGR_PEP_ID=MMETSP0093-20121207/21743_1 /TAXON_ID=311494 /ORGANISM="Alexandrium monilatum, Strain CCMP3105" /LENGTH=94 /DNA_ID=CAMNT_0016517863 /DNA_START=542 /DNA_END=827 /DNA_ORIENTATION=+